MVPASSGLGAAGSGTTVPLRCRRALASLQKLDRILGGQEDENPSCTRRRSSPQIKLTMYGAHDDTCSPFRIALSKAVLDHGGPVVSGMPFYT